MLSASELGVILKPDFSHLKKENLKNWFPELISVKCTTSTVTVNTVKYLITIKYEGDVYYGDIQDKQILKSIEDGTLPSNTNSIIVHTDIVGLDQFQCILDQLGSYLITLKSFDENA